MSDCVKVNLDAIVPSTYDSFDEMLRYFTAGNGEQHKLDLVRVDELAHEIQFMLTALDIARQEDSDE